MIIKEICVLGTDYKVIMQPASDTVTERGHCDEILKQIVIYDLAGHRDWKDEPSERIAAQMRETLRHEIVHAFLVESGLAESALSYEGAWATNEEMVDWFALQGMKICRAWREAGAIEAGSLKEAKQ